MDMPPYLREIKHATTGTISLIWSEHAQLDDLVKRLDSLNTQMRVGYEQARFIAMNDEDPDDVAFAAGVHWGEATMFSPGNLLARPVERSRRTGPTSCSVLARPGPFHPEVGPAFLLKSDQARLPGGDGHGTRELRSILGSPLLAASTRVVL